MYAIPITDTFVEREKKKRAGVVMEFVGNLFILKYLVVQCIIVIHKSFIMTTFKHLFDILPPFLFWAMMIYTVLAILRFKKFSRIPFWCIGLGILILPGSFLFLPYVSLIEVGFHLFFIYKYVRQWNVQ